MNDLPRLLLSAATACVIAACVGDQGSTGLATAPVTADPAEILAADAIPHFVKAEAGAPVIANPVVSFWAKKGTFKEVFMYYASRPAHSDSAVFVRFRVKAKSLVNFPNGQPMQNGDSVFITITLVDPVNLIVDCQPAGLLFNPAAPAKIKMSYLETDPDRDLDGDVDKADAKLTRRLRIWKQDPPAPWLRIGGINAFKFDEVEADVSGFTTYAVAY